MQIRRNFVAAFLLFGSLLTLSCSISPASNKPTESVKSTVLGDGHKYFPLVDGSKWEFIYEFSNAYGIQKGKKIVRVDGQETINDKVYYKLISAYSGIPGAESDVSYYRYSSEGIFYLSSKDKSEILYLPNKLEVGTTWIIPFHRGDTFCRVESMESAELFDRKYENCFKITFERTEKDEEGKYKIKGYEYLAPGIGTVKIVRVIENLIYSSKIIEDISLDSFK